MRNVQLTEQLNCQQYRQHDVINILLSSLVQTVGKLKYKTIILPSFRVDMKCVPLLSLSLSLSLSVEHSLKTVYMTVCGLQRQEENCAMHHSPCYLGDKIKEDCRWAVGEGSELSSFTQNWNQPLRSTTSWEYDYCQFHNKGPWS